MTLYTCLPLDVVLDGIDRAPGPFIEVGRDGLTMLVEPTAPGVGRIVRLIAAPLDCYLKPEFAPGALVYYGAGGFKEKARPAAAESPPLM